jgi:hypothetical protein
MCLKYRMSNNSQNPGVFGAIGNAFSAATTAVTNVVTGPKKNNSNKNSKNTAQVVPVTTGVNISTNTLPVTAPNNTAPAQSGGVAPTNYSTPYDQRQPSERIMNWATTAGLPAPTGPEMRNVAYGGKRSTKKRSTKKRSTKKHKSVHRRSSRGGRSHSLKRKSHRRKHHKKRK